MHQAFPKSLARGTNQHDPHTEQSGAGGYFLWPIRCVATRHGVDRAAITWMAADMRNADYWSMFALAMAVMCMAVGRDISANVFLGALIAIQGLTDTRQPATHVRRIRIILSGLSAAIIGTIIITGKPW